MNKLFLIKTTYIQSMDMVEKMRPLHREYLKNSYKNNKLLLSGPYKEHDNKLGGIIIGKFDDFIEADEFAKNDPFYIDKIAIYEILEFEVPLFNDILKNYFS